MHGSSKLLHGSLLPAARLISAGTWEAPVGKDFPAHQHTTWELVYYRSGNIECPIGDQVYNGQPGVLLTIPPGVVHSELARTAYTNFWVQIDAPADMPWPRVSLDDRENTIRNVCAAIVREYREQPLGYAEMSRLLVWQFDILLQRFQEQQALSTAERLVRQVEHIVAERHATPLKLEEIAQEVGVSSAYLRAQFVRLRGRTPSAHVQAVRVSHALVLLSTSSFTLEAIAQLCGYDSASHLSRHIKRVTGETPGALRS